MSLAIPNTHRVIAKLQAHGFTEDQAVGIAEAFEEIDVSTLATKSDLQQLKASLIQWYIGVLVAQTALFVAIIQLLQ